MKKKTKNYETSKTDSKLDKAQAKKGIKEGSKKDLAIDAVASKRGLKAGMAKLKKTKGK